MRRQFNDVLMSREEIDEFLGVPRYGALATIKQNGHPHIDPLGFNYREGRLYFSVEETRVLLKRVARNPSACFSVFDQEPPSSAAVQVSGSIRRHDDPHDELSLWIFRRYLDPGATRDDYERAWLGRGKRPFRRIVLELTPVNFVAWNNRKSAAYARRHPPDPSTADIGISQAASGQD